MKKYAMLIDVYYCTGCHSCEVACQVKNGLPAGRYGIKLTQVGPWEVSPKKWQYRYFPVLTDQCNLCADRLAAGKLPSCVQHCQAQCLEFGPIDQLAKQIDSPKKILFPIEEQ